MATRDRLSATPKLALVDTAIEKQLGYQFKDPGLLRQALTHRSFGVQNNERLEFLGDAVLNLAVARMLIERQSELSEGELSRIRSNLVNQQQLHEIAKKINLSPLLHLGEGEMRSGGRERASILADALEALIGAVFMEAGFVQASAVVEKLYAHVDMQGTSAKVRDKDAKTQLQEWLQAKRLPLATYVVQDIQGAAHQQLFTIACEVPGRAASVIGRASSKRAAEQAAAQKLLDLLQKNA